MTTSDTPSTQLRPPWLHIARGLWIFLAAAGILAMLASNVIAWREPLPSCVNALVACGPWTVTQEDAVLAQELGFSAPVVKAIYLAAMFLAKLIFMAVGVAIFVRRSDDWVALMLSLMLVLFAVEGVFNLGPVQPLVNFLYAIPTVLFVVLPFIFPSGRFVPRWTGWIMPPVLVATVLTVYLPQLGVRISNQLYSLALLVIFAVWFVLAVYSAIYRYRRVSGPAERQQTKWVIAGMLGTFLLFIPFTAVLLWFPPATATPQRLAFMILVFTPAYLLSYMCLPLGVAFAVLRYRLWDIDVLVRKTLIYTVLTGLLALVFFGVVTLLSGLLSAVTGQQSALAVVASTLVIAALFNPLRRRVQEGIDRRFFRKKYDAQQVLAQFALFARDETDLDALTGELARVIQETLQPESVSIWLRKQ
jgi:hypothetical protein